MEPEEDQGGPGGERGKGGGGTPASEKMALLVVGLARTETARKLARFHPPWLSIRPWGGFGHAEFSARGPRSCFQAILMIFLRGRKFRKEPGSGQLLGSPSTHRRSLQEGRRVFTGGVIQMKTTERRRRKDDDAERGGIRNQTAPESETKSQLESETREGGIGN